MAAAEPPPTRVMIGVSESTIKGYPHASISSRVAFDWPSPRSYGPTLPVSSSSSSTSKSPTKAILNVYASGAGLDDMDSIYASPEDFKILQHRDKARGIHLLEYFVRRCHDIGVRCEAWIKQGDPEEVICHEVKRVRPDFLVVGSRGLGPFQRVFVGTVSEFCAKHVECPIITIKRLLRTL